jgi:hypothetical protein
MSAAVPIIKTEVRKINIAGGGATGTVDFVLTGVPYENKLIALFAKVIATDAPILTKAARLFAEIVVTNKGATVAALTAKTNSSNPINSNTAGFLNTSRVQACDTAFDTATAVWTVVSATTARLTITNNGSSGSTTADFLVVVEIEIAGSA